MALGEKPAAMLSAVVVAGLAVALGFGVHSIFPVVDSSPSANPTASSGVATDEFCALMSDMRSAMGSMDEAMQNSTLILNGGESSDPEVLDALHTSGQAIIDSTGIVSEHLRSAAGLVMDQDAAAAFTSYARVNDALGEAFGTLAIEAESVTDYGIAFGELVADPEFAVTISEADAVEPIVLDYVLETCGIDLSASSGSGTMEDILKAEASTLGKEMASYYVDWSPGDPQPVITVSGGEYFLNGVLLGTQSTGVALTDQYALGPADWCVEVTADGNPGEIFSYSAMRGLRPETCASIRS